jgi:hypothetical protein
MVRLGTRRSLVILICSTQLRAHKIGRASFHSRVGDGTVLHPWMEEKGMTTMRLHRLHFSSRLWPLTFAISWPHSQRVSDVSAIDSREGPVLIELLP